MKYKLITEVDQLEDLCRDIKGSKTLMLDTEFVRTRTLFPKLGLIQLFDGNCLALIDPISVTDLSSLWQLLADPSIVKVFHACSEDLEVFQHVAGFIPTPIMDTQIMATFLGHKLSTGFASLVFEYLNNELDKGEARTDWCARPLTEKQLNYAAADVYYLFPLFELLQKKILETGWYDELIDECQHFVIKRTKKTASENAYLDIKNAWQLKPKQLAVLQKLASWRLKEAKQKDLALNFVVKDLHLWKMAKYNIRSLDKMRSEGFERNEIERYGNHMIRIVDEINNISSDNFPPVIKRLVDHSDYKQVVKQIREQVEKVSIKLNMVPEFIASKKQIHQLLKWIWYDNMAKEQLPDLLNGWRGKHLSPLIESILVEIKQKQ